MVTLATGTAERRASETMLKAKVKKLGRRITSFGECRSTGRPTDEKRKPRLLCRGPRAQ
jgi:hypothetical protein